MLGLLTSTRDTKMDFAGFYLFCLIFMTNVDTQVEEANADYPLLRFTKDLPNELQFSNSTGMIIKCLAEVEPTGDLSVTWEHVDGIQLPNISGIRQVLADGTLQLLPFHSRDFRQDVHMATYRCRALSAFGSIISTNVNMRAVMDVEYESNVYDVFAVRGNMAVVRCHIPTMLESHVSVDAFIRDDTLKITAAVEPEGRYFLSPAGVLYITDVGQSDANRAFKCQTSSSLTKEIHVSSKPGKLFVTDPHGNIPPKILDSTKLFTAHEGQTFTLACVAQGWPVPTVKWSKLTEGKEFPVKLDHIKYKQTSVGLIVSNASLSESGIYLCRATNAIGTDHVEITVQVSAKLHAEIQPSYLELDLAKTSFKLSCVIFGKSVKAVWWMKNGKLLSNQKSEELNVNLASAEDRGVYQCFAQNNAKTVQGSAVVELGNFQPSFVSTFRETTVHTNSFVNVECEATGNPLAKINWHLDGTLLRGTDRIFIDEFTKGSMRILSSLKIKSTQVQDGGLYTCVAKNNAGEVTHDSRINVYGSLGSRGSPEVIVVVGTNAHLNCPIYGYPIKSTVWKRGGKVLPYGLHQKVLNNGTLLLKNVHRTEDNGDYECVARDNEGNEVTATVRINIMVAPKIMPFSFQEELLREGMRAQLQCVITEGDPPISISWVKDGIAIPRDLDVTVRDVDQFSSILAIRTITPRHNGNYTCAATNAVGTVTHSAQLAVNVPPKITPFAFQDDQFFKGMRALIVCAVTRGDLPLHFRWLKDSRDIAQSHSLQINIAYVDEYSSSLSIESVSSQHSGNYTCRVGNGAGNTSHTAQLLVQVSPRIVPFSFQSDQMFEGAFARTTCAVYQGDLPLEISWLKDGRLIIEDSIEIKVVDVYTSVMTIAKVERSHSGSFTCVAKNSASSTNHTAKLEVKVPPKIVAFSFQADELVEGMFTRVSCVVSRGDLPIHIWWTKNGRTIPPDNDMQITVRKFDDFTSVLSINSLASKHNGNYSCFAKNGADTTSFTTHLVVNVPPRWSILPRDELSVVQGEGLNIHCQAEGYPKPVITWIRAIGSGNNAIERPVKVDRHMTSYSNGTLAIFDAEPELEGSYYCSASNGVGRGLTTAVLLRIQKPAKIINPAGNHTVKKGDEAILKCEAIGDEPLQISWFIGAKMLPDPKYTRYSMKRLPKDGIQVSDLRVEKASKSDSVAFTCSAKNKLGNDSNTIWLIVQGRPDPPHGVKVVDRGNRTVEVTWNIPFDGNSPLIRFLVEYKEKGGNVKSETVSGSSVGLAIKGLKPSTWYKISVAAENDIGRSEAEGVAEITLSGETPDGMPGNVEVQAITVRSLKVSWKAPPKNTWNGNIRGYLVSVREVDSKSTVDTKMLEVPEGYEKGLSFSVSDLKEFTRYGIVVQAFNDHGRGPASEEIIIMTSEDVPNTPPDNVSCYTTGSGSIYVSWTRPLKFVHGILRGFRILYWPVDAWIGQDSMEMLNVSTSNASLAGLEKYTNYSIQVLAYTMAGDGTPSNPVYCETTQDVPSKPESVKAFASSGESVMIVWRPPMKRNGKIIHYTVYVEEDGFNGKKVTRKHIVQANGNYYQVTELFKIVYKFYVSASTEIGEGDVSSWVQSEPSKNSYAAAKCAAVNEIVKCPIDQSLQLFCPMVGIPVPRRSWFFKGVQMIPNEKNKFQLDGSVQIDKVQISDSGNYTCIVENSHGQDQVTYQLIVEIPPPAPLVFVTAKSQNSISLRWKLESEEKYLLHGYILNFKEVSGEWISEFIPPYKKSRVINNLICGSRYQIYMNARNKIGDGNSSATVSVSTEGDAPTVPAAKDFISESSSHVTLNLNAWMQTGCSIARFMVEYKTWDSKAWKLFAHDIVPEQKKVVLDYLEEGTRYVVKVTAYTAAASVVADYNVTTASYNDGIVEEDKEEATYNMLERLNIKVMIIVSTCIIVAVTIGVTIAYCWIRLRNGGGNVVHGEEPPRVCHLGDKSSASETPNKKRSCHFSGSEDEFEPYAVVKLSDFHPNAGTASSANGTPHNLKGNFSPNTYNPSAPPLSENYAVYASTSNKKQPRDKTYPGHDCQKGGHSGKAQGGSFKGVSDTPFKLLPLREDFDLPPPPDFNWSPNKK